MSTRMKVLVSLLSLLALVAASCGDDGGDAGSDAGSDPTVSEGSGDGGGGDEILTDFGVTDSTIRVGLNADLSGPFAGLVSQITDAQRVYFDNVNANGGIGGRDVELVVIDNAYDVPTHLENYEEMSAESEDGVLIFSQSTGSPHTTSTAESLVEDNLLAIPLSWYSGWADPSLGQNVFEAYTNYCFEGINGVDYLTQQFMAENGGTLPTLAIVGRPGEYGQDGSAGARIAAEALGLEIVYDGEGAIAGDDLTPVISQIVNSNPDIVWATASSGQLASILGGAVAEGFEGQWSGNYPTYAISLLDGDVAEAVAEYYTQFAYTAGWGSDVAGMAEMMELMIAAQPEALVSDNYILGWTEAMITEAILQQAADNGDMTRAGVVAAANEVSVDFQGLAPDQTWNGDPNDYVVRGSFVYDIDLDAYNPGATISEGGGTGSVLLERNFISSISEEHIYDGPCFVAEG